MDREELEKAKRLIAEDKSTKLSNLSISTLILSAELNRLIDKTPTGEERNNYTNLNIMHLDIMEKLKEFNIEPK